MEEQSLVSNNIVESDQASSQAANMAFQPSVLASPATPASEKKPRARANSDSSSTPRDSKIAKVTPRATRSSQNPDFAAKQRKFLNRVHDPTRRDNSDSENSQGSSTPTSTKVIKDNKTKSLERKTTGDKRKLDKDLSPKRSVEAEEEGSSKKRRTKEPTKVVGGVDSYCWRCHRDGNVIRCEICPRVYHLKCVQMETAPSKGWMCPECSTVMQAENTDSRSRAMRMLSLDQLCNLLRFALNRMQGYEGSDDFARPVDIAAFPQYRDFIVKPMDLMQLKQNIKAKLYGSTEAFLADAKWIVHNSIIFNSVQSKFTNTARALLKICRQEMQEIENCPDCYQNAHIRSSDSWFIEACRRPHLLVWAKLKGFPFWPAKAMTTNSDNLVDVRFFGAHDRAWVPVNSCFLYSKLSPAPSSNKNKRNLEECIQELESHIKKLRDKFGQFEYPPYKTPYDPKNENVQLSMFLPMYEAKTPGKRTVRLHQDGARKSLTQRKSTNFERPAHKSKLEDTSKPSPSVTKNTQPSVQVVSANTDASLKTMVPPMVSFPDESKPDKQASIGSPKKTKASQNHVTAQVEEEDQQESFGEPLVSSKQGGTLGIKKPHKVPLTAAAKKCFATEEKSCFKCKTKATMEWSIDSGGKSLCSSCTLSPSKTMFKEGVQKEKNCAKCHAHSSTSRLTSYNRELLCATCILSQHKEVDKQIQSKKDAQADNPNCIDKETVQKNCGTLEGDDAHAFSDIRESDSVSIDKLSEASSGKSVIIDKGGGGDGPQSVDVGGEPTYLTDDKNPDQEFPAVDSPPKFIISKSSGSSSPESSKKVSIVDRLQEKLCFVVEEAIKVHLTPEEDSESVNRTITDSETVVGQTLDKEMPISNDAPVLQVVLHDLKNSKDIKSLIEDESKETTGNTSKDLQLETQLSSESSSEPDTDVSSSAESDVGSFIINGETNKKKKQNNINNVVRNLTERKTSVDEINEQNNKVSEGKEPSTLSLDDSNDEGPVLIIDEGDSSDGKKSTAKSDKSRRKGIPAKISNRSSTSTESSEISLSEERLNKTQGSVKVLDEVSGQFRSSDESNVVISLVSDSEAPKKSPKKLRSVNISKSLSLSVINSSSSLEMECVESDLDDQMIVDSVIKKVTPRPTARKTLPNPPPRSLELPNPQDKNIGVNLSKVSESEAVKPRQTQTLYAHSTSPPPLTSLQHPLKVFGSTKVQNGGVLVAKKNPTVRTPAAVSLRTELGPANAQLEEAVTKMSTQLRSVLEGLLRGMSESGATDATVKALQMEMERIQWRHRQEIAELRHNTDLVVMEIRAGMEAEKQKALLDAKHKHEIEKEQAIQDTKRKQWCAFCFKEAQLYCCWNTAYCSYICQQSHWPPHMSSCLNKQQQGNNSMDVPLRPVTPRQPFNSPPGQVGYLINNS